MKWAGGVARMGDIRINKFLDRFCGLVVRILGYGFRCQV
jgi:hypothetical protein